MREVVRRQQYDFDVLMSKPNSFRMTRNTVQYQQGL
jgi:hypothetical protein